MSNKQVTPQMVEDDKRFEEILDRGHGVHSTDSELGSVAIAAVIDRWQTDLAGGATLPNMLCDIDNLIATLTDFKKLVEKDRTIIDFPDEVQLSVALIQVFDSVYENIGGGRDENANPITLDDVHNVLHDEDIILTIIKANEVDTTRLELASLVKKYGSEKLAREIYDS